MIRNVGVEGYLRDYTLTAFRMPRIGPVIIGTIQGARLGSRLAIDSVAEHGSGVERIG